MFVGSPPQQRKRAVTTAPPDRRVIRAVGLLVSFGILVLLALGSIAIGAKELSSGQVWHGLFHDTGTYGDVVVGERLSRTVLGLLAGAALGLSGALLQALTRNPLADPGLLGTNAGASAAVVTANTYVGVTSLGGYGWFAFLGAAAVGALVWFLGGSRGATPVRLALAGQCQRRALRLSAGRDDPRRGRARQDALLDGRFAGFGDRLDHHAGPAVPRGGHGPRAVPRPAAATAAAGPVACVALTAPQLARRLTRSPGPNLVPSMCMGATLLITADLASQRAFGADQLPVGVVTGVLGGVHLLWLLVTERKAGRI